MQTIYAVAPPGTIEFQERVVEAETFAPMPELTTQGKLKIIALGLAVLLVLGAVAFFVFRPQLEKAADNLTGLKIDDLELVSDGFDDYFSIKKAQVNKRRGGLVVEVVKGERWDGTVADPETKVPADLDWDTLMTIQSLRRGYVRCELFDKDGKYIGASELRFHGLAEAKGGKLEAVIALPRSHRPAKIVLRF